MQNYLHSCLFVYVTALSDWLPALGYAYRNLVPPIMGDNTVRRNHVTRTTTSSCGHRVWSEQLQTTPCLRLHDCSASVHMSDDRVSLSVRPYVFGAGIIIRTTSTTSHCQSHCQRVTVDVLDTADVALSRLAVLLLNNSLFLTTYFSVADRRQVHHYIKPSSSLARLHDVINRDVIKYRGDVTLTLTRLSRHDVHVSVINDVAVLHVRHVRRSHVDLTTERRHVNVS